MKYEKRNQFGRNCLHLQMANSKIAKNNMQNVSTLPTHDVMHGFKLIIVVISEADRPIDFKRSANNNPNCCKTGNVNSCKTNSRKILR